MALISIAIMHDVLLHSFFSSNLANIDIVPEPAGHAT